MPSVPNITQQQIVDLLADRCAEVRRKGNQDPEELGWTNNEWSLICEDFDMYADYLYGLRWDIENGVTKRNLVRKASALPFVPDEFWIYIDAPNPAIKE